MNECVDVKASERDGVVGEIVALLEVGVIDEEEAADVILELEGALERASGTFTAKQLARRMRLETDRLPVLQEAGVPEAVVDGLVSRRLDELVSLARMKPMEEICLRMCVAGANPRLIAGLLGIGQRRVRMHLRIARRKARQVYDEGPYAGWYEVYLSEVRRGKGEF